MDKLKAMQAFIHIADLGSLTEAARVMASSLPTMVRTWWPARLFCAAVPAHPKALLQANCLRVTGHAPVWGPFNHQGRQQRLAVSGNLEFNQNAPAIAACIAGVGFGGFLSYQVWMYRRSAKV